MVGWANGQRGWNLRRKETREGGRKVYAHGQREGRDGVNRGLSGPQNSQ